MLLAFSLAAICHDKYFLKIEPWHRFTQYNLGMIAHGVNDHQYRGKIKFFVANPTLVFLCITQHQIFAKLATIETSRHLSFFHTQGKAQHQKGSCLVSHHATTTSHQQGSSTHLPLQTNKKKLQTLINAITLDNNLSDD
uniref:Uncharacterized protein n=1 Tax=Physcomitrium patens TaxID=3218 RepID=A0A2K1KH65_PHYPA|nr:hypothetical protein PHYPA_009492 [Physcomitrium patens]